jgi:hypothetical protein
MYQIIELVIDENDDMNGIEAISVVENPAIESDFIALKSQDIQLAEVDKEKRILMGAALIPNKHIFRRDKEREFYIFFAEDTVRKASEIYLKKSRQHSSTLEHESKLEGMTVVETWIVDNPEMDKSKHYGLSVPKGTWMVSMKVDNDEIWKDYVKTGKVKGFSIEAYFTNKVEMLKHDEEEIEAEEIINEIVKILSE